ncbi:MAG: tRNA dihydrouridine(20/20a) synthase DusA [Gammaproteobacteria bacterium]|nr:tRNA dihydrouridine(20/20a) synthase DusA [Gammaproteobacteria bacterium]
MNSQNAAKSNAKRISVAPMMDWTDRHYRHFARMFHPDAWLYSEMVTTGALIFGDRDRYLSFNDSEHPVVLQLGGSDPQALATCSKMAQDYGYDEVNLNVGCPSDRVQNNKIGACLMAEPKLVAECIAAMQNAVTIPVTVKHRIGIDDLDSYEEMLNFVDTVAATGCKHFIVHARIAILKGLSPKENRDIPPLRYEDVYRLKRERPHLTIEINGGLSTVEQINQQFEHTDGVMIGRAAYHNPYLLAEVGVRDELVLPDRFQIMEQYLPYLEEQVANGVSLSSMTRHLLGLFQYQVGARHWRQMLSGGNAKTLADVHNALDDMHELARAAAERQEARLKLFDEKTIA